LPRIKVQILFAQIFSFTKDTTKHYYETLDKLGHSIMIMSWISVIDSPRLVCVPLSAYLVQTRSVGGMAFIKAIQEADPTLPMARRRADCDGPGPAPKTDQSAPVEKPNTLEVG
jgi:hypothetical protein